MTHTRWFVLLVAALLVFAVLIPVAAIAQDQELSRAGKNALKLATRVVRSSRATDEQTIEALKGLELFPHVKVTEFIVKKALPVLRDDRKRPESYQAALDALSHMTDDGSQGYLRERVFDQEVPGIVRALFVPAVCESLAEVEEDADQQALLDTLLLDGAWQVRNEAVLWMRDRRVVPEGVYESVKKRVADEKRVVKTHAIPVLIEYARVAGKKSERELDVLGFLVQRLHDDESRAVGDIWKALKKYTKEEMDADPGMWAFWFQKYKRDAERGEDPDDGAPDGDGENGDEDDKGETETKPQSTFFNTDSFGKKLVYVIDRSVSMKEEISPETLQRMQSQTRGPDDDDREPLDWTKIKSKWDLAVAELTRTIKALPVPRRDDDDRRGRGGRRGRGSGEIREGDVAFTIVSYAEDITVWKPTLMLATPQNKRDAIKWIDRLNPQDQTNIYGALSKAFDIAEGKAGRASRVFTDEADTVDTIFFLTDGFATAGDYQGDEEIKDLKERRVDYGKTMDKMLKRLRERNAKLSIEINTIGLGRHDARTLMYLARQNNGTYTPLGAPD